VEISGIVEDKASGSYSIFGTFSLMPHHLLNWYHDGYSLDPGNPHYDIESDGLNIVLHIANVVDSLYGKYILTIDLTGISENIMLLPGTEDVLYCHQLEGSLGSMDLQLSLSLIAYYFF